jgi:hypothetical protein
MEPPTTARANTTLLARDPPTPRPALPSRVALAAGAGYLSIDPKLSDQAQQADPSLVRRGPFRDAIVVVIGGGSYLEYQNLQDYTAQGGQAGSKHVLYGCTELLTGSEMLSQLAQLGPAT